MREEGISQKRDINLFPLLPFPLSLTLKAKPPPTAEPKKPPVRAVFYSITVFWQFSRDSSLTSSLRPFTVLFL